MYALNFPFFLTEADLVPLVSILVYVRLALCCDQQEVINLLLERATSLAETSSDPAVGREMVCIRVLQTVDSVRGVARGRKVTLTGGESHPGQYTYTAHTRHIQTHTHKHIPTHAALVQEPGEMLTRLSSLVHSASQDPVLLVGEQDLLRDSTLFLWETVCPAFSQLHSNLPAAIRPLTASRRGREVGQECVYNNLCVCLYVCVYVVCRDPGTDGGRGRIATAMESTPTALWRAHTQALLHQGVPGLSHTICRSATHSWVNCQFHVCVCV